MSFFLTNIFSGPEYCPMLLETVGLLMPNQNFRNFSLFNINFKFQNCPSARCSSASNIINIDANIFSGHPVLVNDWLVSDTVTT
jgi:hypothetical protein